MSEHSRTRQELIEENTLLKEKILELERQSAEENRSEDALRESEEKLATTLNSIGDGVIATDEHGLVVNMNPRAEKLCGWVLADAMGRHLSEVFRIVNAFTREPLEDPVRQVLETLEVVGLANHTLLLSRDGTEYHIADSAAPVRNRYGKVTGVVLVFSDFTEKYAEKLSKESEEKYKAAFENAGIGMDLVDDKGRFIEVNAAFAGMLGYSPEELQGMTIVDVTHPDDCEKSLRHFGDVISGGNSYRIEKRYVRKDGEVLWADLCVSKIMDDIDQDSITMGVIRDITEHKRSDEALRLSEEENRRLFETMAQGVIYQDTDGAIISANPAAERILGLTFDRMCGKTSMDPRWKMIREDGSPVPGTEHPSMVALRTGRKIGPVTRGVFHPEKNAYLWLSITAIPLFQPGETVPFQAYATFEDITERKQSEEEKERLQTQLTQAQKMESVGRLAGGVAHDFNNMLGIILGHTDMALEYLDPGQPVCSNLTEIRKATMRSADLVRQLLAFARKQTIAPKVLDLNDTVEGMLKMLRRLIGEDIDLSWMPGKNLWPVNMDPTQIDQILANLCVNARDAIDGVGKVTIETDNVTLDEDQCNRSFESGPGDYVLLAVSDDGCGMDKEILDKIFDPFFTTKEVGKGTGLGLPTVYGIVEQNEGFIDIYTEHGRGTTFRIYIPRYIGEAEKKQSLNAGISPTVGGHETVLLVEDEPILLRMGVEMLERLGYKVLAAGSPTAAIKMAEEHKDDIHLLITDVIMPEMNGRELADRLSAIYPCMKLIFMSGYTADVISSHGALDFGVKFIQKPFSMKDLANRIREALEG